MISQEIPLPKVSKRVISLKEQKRRLKQIGLVAVTLAASLVVMGQDAPQKNPVQPKVVSGPSKTGPHPNDRGRRIYNDCAGAVFLLYIKSPSGELIAQGSGFLVASKKIITNAHVAKAGDVVVELGPARVPARVEKVDEFNDLALLTVDAEILTKPLSLADVMPAPGDSVFAISNPEALERTISEGLVSAIRTSNGRQLIQITSPISHGSSGGPILNTEGQVIGVAVGILTSGQNLNFAVPLTAIKTLLAGGSAVEASNSLATLEEVQSIRAERDQEKYSADPNSAWRVKTAQIDDLLRRAIDQSGNDPAILLRVAKAALSEDFDIAILAARRAVELKTTSEGQLVLAQALTAEGYWGKTENQQKLYAEAEKDARSAIAGTHKPTAEMYYALADVLEDMGTYVEAAANFRLALSASRKESDPNLEVQSIRGLCRCADSLNNIPEARTWFEMLRKDGNASAYDWQSQGRRLGEAREYQDAGDAYTTAAKLGAPYTNWCDAATMYSIASQSDSILSCARSCIADGTGKDNSERYLAIAHRQIADVLNERGVYDEALTHAKEATDLDSSDPWAYAALADSLSGLRRFQETINAAKQAIRLSDGKYPSMHFRLGSAYFDTENWEFARQSFEKAAELAPKDPASAYNIALCFQHLGLYLDAAHWFEEVLRRDPNRTDREDLLNKIRILKQ
jgi:tetratricopeptide (TPR) repeat protein